MKLRTISRIALGFGIALVVSAAAMLILVPGSGKMSTGQAVVGLGLIVFYMLTNKGAVGSAFAGRGTLFYGASALIALLLLGGLGALNYIVARQKVSWDLTKEKIFTLAPETKDLLRNLDEEIQITAFFATHDAQYEAVKHLLDRYQRESEKVVVTYVDPDKEPQLVQEKQISQHGPRLIFARGAAESKVAEISEEGFTNALRGLLYTTTRKIYFVSGHGEADLEDTSSERGYGQIAKRLDTEGIEHERLHLSAQTVPEDAAALAIIGPKRPFLEEEVAELRRWLDTGGRLLVALEPGYDDPHLLGLLEEQGFIFENALIVDPLSRLFGGGDAIPVIQQYAEHAISRAFQFQTVFPTARPITSRGDVDPRPLVLATTNPSAWGETEWRGGEVSFDPETERRGALGIVAVLDKEIDVGDPDAPVRETAQVRIAAFGDSDFVSNRFVQAGGNADLFLNTLNWLSSEEERITIRPRQRAASGLMLTEADAKFLNFFSIAAMPMLVLAVGLSVWLVRRSK